MSGSERIDGRRARAGAAKAAIAAVVVGAVAVGLAGPARAGDGVRGINLPSMGTQYLTEPSGEPGRGINLPSMGKQYLIEPGGERSAPAPPRVKALVPRPMPVRPIWPQQGGHGLRADDDPTVPVRPIWPGPQQRPHRPAPQAPWNLAVPMTPGPGPATAPAGPNDWPQNVPQNGPNGAGWEMPAEGDWAQPGPPRADEEWKMIGSPNGNGPAHGGPVDWGSPPGLGDDPFGDQSGPFGGPSNPFGDHSDPLGGPSSPFGGESGPFGDDPGPSGGPSDPLGGFSDPFGGSDFGPGMGDWSIPDSGPLGGAKDPFGGPGPIVPGKGPAGADHVGRGSGGPLGDWYYTEGGPRWVRLTEYHKGMAEMEDAQDAARQDYGSGLLDDAPRERSDPYPPSEEYYEREREEGEFLKAQEEFLKEKQRMEELQQQKEQDENGSDDDDDDDNDNGNGTEGCEGPDDPGGGRPNPNEIDPGSVTLPGELITDPAHPQDSGSSPWGSPPAGWHSTKDPGQASNPGPEGAQSGGRPIKGGVRFKGVLITDPPEPEG